MTCPASAEPMSALSTWIAKGQLHPGLRIGVAFSNLHVRGFDSTHQLQSTVGSYATGVARFIYSLFRNSDQTEVQILRGFDGLVRDSEMLLVLGRPGSGCTTLLRALSGDTHGLQIDSESVINYAGVSHQDFQKFFQGESVYLAETDVHFPELTLSDTLTIAAATRKTEGSRLSESRKLARIVSTLFQLDRAFDTRMGNSMIKGCSGGEKRRASIAEALEGAAQLQFWDNSTRGLDSSTALKFVELLRQLTRELHTTVAMSVYQASESIFRQFDKVTILYDGRQIYFGPIELAVQYFYELGFEKAPRATTPDFLSSLTNPPERIIRFGYEDRVPRSADDFARVWKQSARRAQLLSQISRFNEDHPSLTGKGLANKLSQRTSTYVIATPIQILVCLGRAIQRFRRQPAPVIGAVFANAILALVVGSVFFNLADDSDSMDRRAVLIFFSLLVTALSPAFEVLTIWAQRPIVEKHDRYAFYFPFTDAAASMIWDLPNKVASAVLFQTTIYFMTHLRRTPGAFFTWFLFNFVLVLNMSMWFRFIGSISRTMEQTTAPTCILVLLWCIYAGFVVPIPYMVGWLKWFRFLNPIAYAYESVMINEFQHRNFSCSTLIPSGNAYLEASVTNKVCTVVGASSGQPFVEGGAYLTRKYGFVLSHLWRNLGVLLSMTVIVCAFHLLSTQYIPAERSRGDVLRFRHSKGSLSSRPDTETGVSKPSAQDLGTLFHGKEPYEKVYKKPPTHPVHASTFHWSDLSYEVKLPTGKKKKILDGIDGWVKPGTLTALMGVSGAGKTTLLDVLANRADFGVLGGKVGIDGRERDASFQRKIGYAQQDDIHLSTSTVREALEFSSSLRRPSGASGIIDQVNEIIQLLDMGPYADAVIGVPGDGLNIEQRKRLSIAVELVAKPELLIFLDEPTSGMDSQTAWSICMLLRRLADSGYTILCTIHQPSSQLFRLFDRLLLLSDHGQAVFFGDIGPDASTVIEYFEEAGSCKCDEGINPAEWILTLSSTVPPGAQGETPTKFWADKWLRSPQFIEAINQVPQFQPPNAAEVSKQRDHGQYAATWLHQIRVVTKRTFQEYWRSPVYLYSKVGLCAGVALFNGLSFQNTRLDSQGLQDLIFSMFLLTQMFGTVDQQVIPRFVDARALFEARERRSKTHSWTVHLASNMVLELLWQTVAAVLVFVLWYYPTGLWRNGDSEFGTSERGALTFVVVWLYCLWIVTFSQAAAAGIEHAESAVQLATLIFWFSLVFCGVLVSPSQLPGFWKFVWRASPLTYLIDGLAVSGLKNAPIICTTTLALVLDPPVGLTCGQYLSAYILQDGGTLENPLARSACRFCPISTANSYLYEILQVGTNSPWANAGYFVAFNLFNILMTFLIYWLARVRGH